MQLFEQNQGESSNYSDWTDGLSGIETCKIIFKIRLVYASA